jgi:hypothetical protein
MLDPLYVAHGKTATTPFRNNFSYICKLKIINHSNIDWREKAISNKTEPHRSSNGKPTVLWYIVPLLFGVLGGLVGYMGVKYEDRKIATNLLAFGIAITVVNLILALTLIPELQSVTLAIFVFGGLLLFMYYGLPEVPKSTSAR